MFICHAYTLTPLGAQRVYAQLHVREMLSLYHSSWNLFPLQRVCQDRIFPLIFIFAKGGGRSGTEPIRAYLLTYVIALACIAIGNHTVLCTFFFTCEVEEKEQLIRRETVLLNASTVLR